VLSSACALALALALGAAAPAAPPSPPALERPFHDLATNLVRDIRALPSSDTALIVGVGAAAAFVLHPADDNLAGWVRDGEPSSYTGLGSFLGDGWIQAGAAVATYAVGATRRDPRVTHLGSDLMRAQLLNGVLTRGFKLVAGRERPSGGNHSLPSGHASAAFVSAAVLAGHFGPKVGVPAYVAAGFIGWTRVRDNAHWMTDVVVGAALGTLVGRTVSRHRGPTAWTIIPSASQGGAVVLVVRR
jgi:membrane-associated phospholipid phosphatase